MAKITNYIPEPKEDYDVDNQRQIMESLNTMKQQLNFSFQQDLKKMIFSSLQLLLTVLSHLHPQ